MIIKLDGLTTMAKSPVHVRYMRVNWQICSTRAEFDWVIAPDEWITYAETEDSKTDVEHDKQNNTQRFPLQPLDYKNMYANRRYFEGLYYVLIKAMQL